MSCVCLYHYQDVSLNIAYEYFYQVIMQSQGTRMSVTGPSFPSLLFFTMSFFLWINFIKDKDIYIFIFFCTNDRIFWGKYLKLFVLLIIYAWLYAMNVPVCVLLKRCTMSKYRLKLFQCVSARLSPFLYYQVFIVVLILFCQSNKTHQSCWKRR